MGITVGISTLRHVNQKLYSTPVTNRMERWNWHWFSICFPATCGVVVIQITAEDTPDNLRGNLKALGKSQTVQKLFEKTEKGQFCLPSGCSWV